MSIGVTQKVVNKTKMKSRKNKKTFRKRSFDENRRVFQIRICDDFRRRKFKVKYFRIAILVSLRFLFAANRIIKVNDPIHNTSQKFAVNFPSEIFLYESLFSFEEKSHFNNEIQSHYISPEESFRTISTFSQYFLPLPSDFVIHSSD